MVFRVFIIVVLSLTVHQRAFSQNVSDNDLYLAIGILKDTSGIIGAAQACNDSQIEDDAIHFYRSALKAFIKHDFFSIEEFDLITRLNAETTIKVRNDFRQDGPVSCGELQEVWEEIKTQYIQ